MGQGCRRPENCKVTAVMGFPVPTTKAAVRSFLGLTGYYRDFIPAYASHSIHLTEATRKSAPEKVLWIHSLQEELEYLKKCVCSDPCLYIPVPGDSFLL